MIHALNIHYGPQNKPLVIKFTPSATEGRSDLGSHSFVFGSASHPLDFRCQTCHHFAWGSHGPQDAWSSDAGAIERLWRAALDLVDARKMPVSAAMTETLAAWRKSLRRR